MIFSFDSRSVVYQGQGQEIRQVLQVCKAVTQGLGGEDPCPNSEGSISLRAEGLSYSMAFLGNPLEGRAVGDLLVHISSLATAQRLLAPAWAFETE